MPAVSAGEIVAIDAELWLHFGSPGSSQRRAPPRDRGTEDGTWLLDGRSAAGTAFGTHAAMLGVNPWKLMQWIGHKRIDDTMLDVHFAEAPPSADPRRRCRPAALGGMRAVVPAFER